MQNLILWDQFIWKKLGSNPLADLEVPIGEAGDNWTPPGDTDAGALWGSFFCQDDISVG